MGHLQTVQKKYWLLLAATYTLRLRKESSYFKSRIAMLKVAIAIQIELSFMNDKLGAAR